ncbi:MAG: hypothetical protein F4080_03880 [Holophagales bacterium]|nr:hypothetical protein [Holophagales bacterium]
MVRPTLVADGQVELHGAALGSGPAAVAEFERELIEGDRHHRLFAADGCVLDLRPVRKRSMKEA